MSQSELWVRGEGGGVGWLFSNGILFRGDLLYFYFYGISSFKKNISLRVILHSFHSILSFNVLKEYLVQMQYSSYQLIINFSVRSQV